MTMNNIRDIVNGAQLRGFMNKPVSITGKVNEVDPSGNFFYINSTDDVKVKIRVSQPITNQLSGWIVARGKCTGGQEVAADDFVIFSNEKFDSKAYTELCGFLYSVPNIWQTSDDS